MYSFCHSCRLIKSEHLIDWFQLLDHENELIAKRFAKAMKGGRYPSPSDAKLVDDMLRRAHLNKSRRKLEVHLAV